MAIGISLRMLMVASSTPDFGDCTPLSGNLLLESGDSLLLESGDKLVLEDCTLPSFAYDAPSGLSVTDAGTNKLDLSWTDNSTGEDGFRVERSTDDIDFREVGTTGAGVTTFSDTGVATGVTYYYRVRAFGASGFSNYSGSVSGTPTGEITTSTLNDDFDDNSLAAHWDVTMLDGADGGAASAYITEQNQRLEFGLIGGTGDSTQNQIRFTSGYVFRGDFDFQADFELLNVPASDRWIMFVRGASVNAGVPGKPTSEVRALIKYQGSKQYGGETRVDSSPATIDGSGTYSATSDTSGKLRVTRSGTTGAAYFWNGSSWTQVHSGTVDGSDFELVFWLFRETTSSDVEIALDNFTINSGTVVDTN